MDEESRERIWKEMVESSKRREEGVVLRVVKRDWGKEKGGWRKELMSDLWLLVILLVFWISFVSIIEIVGL